jgi:PAS domain S-box-containing protein
LPREKEEEAGKYAFRGPRLFAPVPLGIVACPQDKGIGGYMKSRTPHSIRRKLSLIISTAVALALVLSVTISFLMNYYLLRIELVRNTRVMADLITRGLEDEQFRHNREEVQRRLSSISLIPSISHAFLLDTEGKLDAAYVREGYGIEAPKPPPANYSHIFHDNKLDVYSPVQVGKDIYAVVALRVDMSQVKSHIGSFAGIALVGLVTALAIATMLSWQWVSLVTDPLINLASVARRVSKDGDYRVRAEKEADDELGELVDAFNLMLTQIEQRDGELQRARDLLEVRVKERTRDLLAENQARKEAQESLRAEKETAQHYLDVAAVIMLALDPDGRVMMINRKGVDLVGYAEADMIGKDWISMAVPSNNQDDARKEFQEVLAARDPKGHYFESVLKAKDGQHYLIAWHSIPLQDPDGQLRGTLSSGEDITQRRKSKEREDMLRERLQRSERLESIGLLAGGVAHDLNNMLGPLTSLPLLMIEDIDAVCHGDTSAAPRIKDDLMEISSSANRAALTIKDLMALSRSSSSSKDNVSLNNLVNDFVETREFSELKSGHPGMSLDLDLLYPLPQVAASHSHIMRVISNLSRNAIEAMGETGTLSIQTRVVEFDEDAIRHEIIRAGRYVVLTIADTGSGIPEESIGKIFDPFYTSKAMSTHSGSGLGLSIVHSIVKDHDGYIDLITGEGQGSRFELFFPVSGAQKTDSMESMASGGKEKILIVDDDRSQRFVARRVLEKFGYAVTEAENGSEAVRLFEHPGNNPVDYDLILMDMVMEPDMDGIAALERIRAVNPQQKAIIVSGYSAMERAEKAQALGAGWVSKPYDSHTIGKAVRDKLDEA